MLASGQIGFLSTCLLGFLRREDTRCSGGELQVRVWYWASVPKLFCARLCKAEPVESSIKRTQMRRKPSLLLPLRCRGRQCVVARPGVKKGNSVRLILVTAPSKRAYRTLGMWVIHKSGFVLLNTDLTRPCHARGVSDTTMEQIAAFFPSRLKTPQLDGSFATVVSAGRRRCHPQRPGSGLPLQGCSFCSSHLWVPSMQARKGNDKSRSFSFRTL